MSKVYLTIPTEGHVETIAQNLRDGDAVEFAALRRDVRSVMRDGMRLSSYALVGMVDEDPVCMFGVAPAGFMTPGVGRPWMVGSNLLDKHAYRFLRRCRGNVAMMTSRYPLLENYVAKSNTLAISWLEWLGFSMKEETMINGIPFLRFEMRRTA